MTDEEILSRAKEIQDRRATGRQKERLEREERLEVAKRIIGPFLESFMGEEGDSYFWEDSEYDGMDLAIKLDLVDAERLAQGLQSLKESSQP